MRNTAAILALSMSQLIACATAETPPSADITDTQVSHPTTETQDLSGLSKAYFASGCFWCVEEVFESVRGVEEAISGYAGGSEKNPTYEQVGSGSTGHAEAVMVYYDPKVVSYATLLKVFFASQDPTTKNRQGPDRGAQYRSIAFYQTPEEKAAIEKEITELDASGKYGSPIVTEVTAFEKFWPAEDYHQNYVRQHPNEGYVRGVSIPRFERFKAQMPDVLK
jgi:peptide-methionine (S)-S-oxide reductase